MNSCERNKNEKQMDKVQYFEGYRGRTAVRLSNAEDGGGFLMRVATILERENGLVHASNCASVRLTAFTFLMLLKIFRDTSIISGG